MTQPIQRRRSRELPARRVVQPRDWVALILAFAIGTAINFITLAVMYDAVHAGAQLSENATQILVAAFGGIIGILGSYVGARTAEGAQRRADVANPPDEPKVPE